MNRAEAHALAQNELAEIEKAGYATASEHIDTAHLENVSAVSGKTYELEISYQWKDQEHENILVVCRVTSKNWFTHEHIEGSLVLCENVD